ncbi:MAG TPA: type II toxin-antitoxin system HicB family antitoxin [Pyrinomonadaceae bacterium]|jgi:predicted RNase H-like HicB family nuclease
MNKYRIEISWSEEDHLFIAEVPELPGCMTHGRTRARARANAKEAIQAWIDTATEFGDPIPKPRRARVTSNILAETKYSPAINGRHLPVRRNNPQNFSYEKAARPTVNPEAH